MPKHNRPTMSERSYVCVESSPGLAFFAVCQEDGSRKGATFFARPYRFSPRPGDVVKASLEYLPTKAKPLPPRMFLAKKEG